MNYDELMRFKEHLMDQREFLDFFMFGKEEDEKKEPKKEDSLK